MPYSALQMADAFIQAGELPDALETLNAHLAAHADDADALRLRAALRLRLRAEADLRAGLADLDALPDLNADDHIQRSIILGELGEWPAARDAAAAARALRPADERIAERYLVTLGRCGDSATARCLLETLPRTWRWLEWSGDLARDAGDPAAAAQHYAAALAHLETRMDTINDALAANLKAVITLKLAGVEGR
ncbi:MAG: hypothetical protein JNJ61_12430 [Anaerolineae bacterium]|nr:hypothetical protein [Anaerolineae bacterium]